MIIRLIFSDLINSQRLTLGHYCVFVINKFGSDYLDLHREKTDIVISDVSKRVAQTLDGELLDESGSTLSVQRERYLREEIIQYQLGV